MNVLGIECGVGSMMIPSKELGFNIIGNIENRKYFNTGTFEKNFDAPFIDDLEIETSFKDIDILFSHPKCGEFSKLNQSLSKGRKLHEGFYTLTKQINFYKPKIFLIDNLPNSLNFYPLTWWSDQLKDYDITAELVSNYNYGNTQKYRSRLFIIGSLKKLKFIFKPNEKPNNKKLREVFKNIENTYNHDLFPPYIKAPGFSPYTIDQVRYIIKTLKGNGSVYYQQQNKRTIYSGIKKSGFKQRIGTSVIFSNKYSPTITGSLTFYLKENLRPLTCRERARIQGVPDWFKFILTEEQMFSSTMGRQTGRFIPVEFIRFFTEYVNRFFNDSNFKEYQNSLTGKRFLIDKLVRISRMENCVKYSHSNLKCLCDLCGFEQCILLKE